MDPAFKCIAAGRTGHTVLGLQLYHLTIGHVFLLVEHGVDFIVESNIEPSFDDLILFTFLAAQPTPRGASRAVSSPLTRPLFWLWGLLSRRKRFDDELAKLREYVSDQYKSPLVKEPTGAAKSLNAPEHWRLLAMLVADFHFTLDQALNTSMLFARALWAVQGERTDKVELVYSPATESALRRLRAQTK